MTRFNISTLITNEYVFHKGKKMIVKSGLKAKWKKNHITIKLIFERSSNFKPYSTSHVKCVCNWFRD